MDRTLAENIRLFFFSAQGRYSGGGGISTQTYRFRRENKANLIVRHQ